MPKIENYDHEGNLIDTTDDRSLADVQAEKSQQVNDYRDIKKDGTIFFNGIQWDSNQQSRDNIVAIVSAITAGIPIPSPFYWRDYNNINQPVTAEFLVGLAGSLLLYINQVYAVSWYHKGNIAALTSNDDVDAYDFTTSWPSNDMGP